MDPIFEVADLEKLVREFTREIAGAANTLVQLGELNSEITQELQRLVSKIEEFDKKKLEPFENGFKRDINASQRVAGGFCF